MLGSTLAGCFMGTLGDECMENYDCSFDYTCVRCSAKSTCYFSDSLKANSDYEWACTTYGSGTPTDERYTGTAAGGSGGGGSGSTSSGGGGGSGGAGSDDWAYTCPGGSGGGGTVPIPRGACETEYKAYAVAYGCNDYGSFKKVCVSLYGCLGQDTTSKCP